MTSPVEQSRAFQKTVSTADRSAGEFRIGRQLRGTFSVLFRNAVKIIPIVLLFQLPAIYINPALFKMTSHLAGGGYQFFLRTTVLPVIPAMFLDIVRNAILADGVYRASQGARLDLSRSAMIAVRSLLPVLALAIIFSIAVAVGMGLLFIPWYIFFSIYAVAVPACVLERQDVLGCFRRSAELTKDCRWKLIGSYLLLQVIAMIVGVASVRVGIGLLTHRHWFMAINLASSTFFGAIGATIIIVTYHQLRIAKEGPDPDRIAAVFD